MCELSVKCVSYTIKITALKIQVGVICIQKEFKYITTACYVININ